MEFETDGERVYAKDFPEKFTFTEIWLKANAAYVYYAITRDRLFIAVYNGEAEYLVTKRYYDDDDHAGWEANRYYLRKKER